MMSLNSSIDGSEQEAVVHDVIELIYRKKRDVSHDDPNNEPVPRHDPFLREDNETSQQKQIINLHKKTYTITSKNLHGKKSYIMSSYRIPFYMFCKLANLWHFDSNQPKDNFHLLSSGRL